MDIKYRMTEKLSLDFVCMRINVESRVSKKML